MWLLFIFGIFILYAIVADLIEKKKRNDRDQAARNVLGSFDYQQERERILSINRANGSFISIDRKCPRCSGFLLLRRSVFGEFFGCSNYPTCRFKRNIKHK